MAIDVVAVRRQPGNARKTVHAVETRKTKHGVKISRHGVKSEPPGTTKRAVIDVTVHSFDPVKAGSVAFTGSIEGTHIIYHMA